MSIENDLKRIADALESLAAISAAAGAAPAGLSARAETVVDPQAKPERKTRRAAAPVVPVATAADPLGGESPVASEGPMPTKDDLIDKLRTFVTTKGVPEGPRLGKELLNKFGVERVSLLPEDKYREFAAELDALMA